MLNGKEANPLHYNGVGDIGGYPKRQQEALRLRLPQSLSLSGSALWLMGF